MEKKKTVYCSLPGCENAARKRCARCKLAFYCSTQHQEADYDCDRGHKRACVNFKRLCGEFEKNTKLLREGTRAFHDQLTRVESVVGELAVQDVIKAHDKTLVLYTLRAEQLLSSDNGPADTRRQSDIVSAFEQEKKELATKHGASNVAAIVAVLDTKFRLIDFDMQVKLRSYHRDNQGNAICGRNKK